MVAKYMLCAVLAIFAFQALNAQPSNKGAIEDAIHDALLKAKDALHNLTVKLEAFGQEAVARISAVIETIKIKGQELLEKAQEKIEEITRAIDAKILEMLELAAEHGVDIVDCVAAEKQAVEDLVDNTNKELLSCVTDQVKKAEDILLEVVSVVKEGLEGAKQSEKNIEACLVIEKPLQVLACLNKNALHDTTEAIRLGVVITKNVLKAEALITAIQAEIPICLAAKLVAAEGAAAIIVKDFGLCVLDQISNKQLIQ